jgi:hypothetical protein
VAKVRVYEPAKEFGLESRAVMAMLRERGVWVPAAASSWGIRQSGGIRPAAHRSPRHAGKRGFIVAGRNRATLISLSFCDSGGGHQVRSLRSSTIGCVRPQPGDGNRPAESRA